MLEHGVVFCLVVVQLGGTWLCWNTGGCFVSLLCS